MTHLSNEEIARAARAADRRLTGDPDVPSYTALLGGRLPARHAPARHARPVRRHAQTPVPAPVPAPHPVPRPAPHRRPASTRPSLVEALRTAAELTSAQVRLLPRALPTLSAIGLAGAVLLALTTPGTTAVRLFGAAVTLIVLAGALCVRGARRDPRGELLRTLPVGPRAVFLARLTLVLGCDAAAALVASATAGLAGDTLRTGELISAWLGPSLLSSAVAVTLTVWRSSVLGMLGGALTWTLVTLPGTGGAHESGLGALFGRTWATTPWVAPAALALFAVATVLADHPRTVRPER
ncbi:hypothetical protein AGRA3207_003490 [Actinomadura graeca]|uniref:Uncharacterized protein n=1 Tax=Actinomadura graeca TaxID=2750812 RepID=A0ABX8QUR5_9ACTN|nr:hypothetical protein [Actinomadura graeca]QXJ22486.1 hypothetical protein AGRA3207_003490 [Actinomadura graeca]